MYIFIGGIPASGKSYLAKRAAEKYGYKTFDKFSEAEKEALKLLN